MSASDELSLWIVGGFTVALIPLCWWVAAREIRSDDRMAGRRLWAFAHPAATVVFRALITLAAVFGALTFGAMAVWVHPSTWGMVAAIVAGYTAMATIWIRARGPLDLEALHDEQDAS
jgi:hypothetical protein